MTRLEWVSKKHELSLKRQKKALLAEIKRLETLLKYKPLLEEEKWPLSHEISLLKNDLARLEGRVPFFEAIFGGKK